MPVNLRTREKCLKTELALTLLAVALSGCANFHAVSAFAQQTSKVTGVVRAELSQLDAFCREQAELTVVVNNITDDGPLKSCQSYEATQGRLAAVTLDVLDDYAKALNGLADDKSFDLDSDLDAVGSKLQSLKDRSGNTLASASEVTALTKVVEVLAEIATERRREAAVKRLVQERKNLVITGQILRSFFVDDPNAPPGRTKAPYANLAGLTTESFNSAEKMLKSKPFQTAEPIRTVELLRGMQTRRAQLEMRTGPSATVPVAIAAAIDAWLRTLDEFTEDALKPEPKELLGRIKDVRSKANAAREALQAVNN
jgi:hypothetical protein